VGARSGDGDGGLREASRVVSVGKQGRDCFGRPWMLPETGAEAVQDDSSYFSFRTSFLEVCRKTAEHGIPTRSV
jgi:hypothetical protein